MSKHQQAPHYRSPLRTWLGKTYFTWRRYLVWLWQCRHYATKRQPDPLPYLVAGHQTPLLRRLRDVDMWLQHNKVVNLKIASQHLHGVILAPGQVLSFWRCLGRATARKGYLPGMVLHNGSFSPQVGGGLCQLSNLIYWMTLHTPLTVTERWRHSFDVFPDADRTQPFGSGATVSYNYIDLQIRNDTPHTYQLQVWVGPTHLRGEWRASTPSTCSYQVYESEHRITHEPWGGYVRHNCIRRRVWDQKGILLRDEYVTENHAVMMYEPLLAESKPS